MYKVVKRDCPMFGIGPYVCEFICDTASDISTLPISISEGTGGKTAYDNQKCASGSIANVAENGSGSKWYMLNNQDVWCPYSVAAGSSGGGSSGSSITVDSALSETSGSPVANKVITAALNEKADITHTHSVDEIGADASGSAASALEEAKAYTDSEIADLINGAPITRDTLKEISDAMDENQTVVEALDAAIGTKANKTDIPTKVSQLENDSGYLTEHQDLSGYAKTADIPTELPANGGNANTVNGHSVEADVPADAVFTDTVPDLSLYALKSKYGDTTINVGRKADTAIGAYSTSEGNNTTASGMISHAEGNNTTASDECSHAEGDSTTASGRISHAEGCNTTASGRISHAEGDSTTASNYSSHACGHYSVAMTDGGGATNTTGTAFVIGNGMLSPTTGDLTKSNAFSVMFDGTVKAKSTITASTTADYAEFFEWLDENPDSEDRVGYFVTMDGDKIRIANADDDFILGVVSGEPFVLGNGDCDTWNGMFLRDEFRRTIYEPAPKIEEILDDDGKPTGEYTEVEGEYEGTRPKLNPEYDHTKTYISRFDRPEWSPVGMLGVLAVRHDGTAKVNGYVTIADGGIATACDKNTENSYRVIKSNTDSVVEIIFR